MAVLLPHEIRINKASWGSRILSEMVNYCWDKIEKLLDISSVALNVVNFLDMVSDLAWRVVIKAVNLQFTILNKSFYKMRSHKPSSSSH